MGAGSIAYSGTRNRIGSVSTMLSNICCSATSAHRHAVDAFLPNIEPDTRKDLDALAEAKAHTQFSRMSKKAASSEVGRATDTAKSWFLSLMRFPDGRSTSCDLALGRAHAKTLVKTEDLTQSRKDAKMNFRREIVTTKAKRNTGDRRRMEDGSALIGYQPCSPSFPLLTSV